MSSIDKIKIETLSGGHEGDIDVPDFFLDRVNYDLIQKRIRKESFRKRDQYTKCVGEVSGSKKKHHNQKGGGRARSGNGKDVQWRGGGIIFGPKPRDVELKLNKRVMKLAMRSLFAMKYQSDKCKVLNDLELSSRKTKDFIKILDSFSIKAEKLLFVVGSSEDVVDFKMASRNVHFVNSLPTEGINATSVMKSEFVIFTLQSINELVERLSL
jgi:large subunit ribosomal protein L4